VTENDDGVSFEASLQVFSELDSVLGQSIEGEIRGSVAIPRERLAGPALIPLHQQEVAVVGSVGRDERRLDVAWPAVEEKKNRAPRVVAPDRDPLIDSAQRDEPCFLDATDDAAANGHASGQQRRGDHTGEGALRRHPHVFQPIGPQ
jgi:hypothetical protein